jgi:hypothetical protein
VVCKRTASRSVTDRRTLGKRTEAGAAGLLTGRNCKQRRTRADMGSTPCRHVNCNQKARRRSDDQTDGSQQVDAAPFRSETDSAGNKGMCHVGPAVDVAHLISQPRLLTRFRDCDVNVPRIEIEMIYEVELGNR